LTATSLGKLAARRNRVHTEREARLSMLRAQIAQGEYRVDPRAIAEAILRRVTLVGPENQNECSYPSSWRSTFPNDTPGGPSMTQPIHARPVLMAASSASLRAVAGMHTHSS
jgi:hypothetical protein